MSETATKSTPKNVRFDTVQRYYKLLESGIMGEEQVKAALQLGETFLHQREIEEFVTKNPTMNTEAFGKFLGQFSLVKMPKEKTERTGNANFGVRTLDTEEGAIERGVAPESIQEYITLVGQAREIHSKINALTAKGVTVAFAIPVPKVKAEMADAIAPAESTPAE